MHRNWSVLRYLRLTDTLTSSIAFCPGANIQTSLLSPGLSVDPKCLTSFQFPYSLCFGHCDTNMTSKVLHAESSGASLESAVDYSATHAKWHVSSLFPVGPVSYSKETVPPQKNIFIFCTKPLTIS